MLIRHSVIIRGGYVKPNVSLCDDNDKVYYNYPIWNTNDKPFVDLNLPSGTLWATMNVGASKPSDYGQYFQWGDTQGYTADQVGTDDGQKAFTWADYKFYISGSVYDENMKFSKYTTTGATLELEDDAAHVNMGGDWHMPTPTQLQELTANTTTAWTTSDDINGMTFTSKKDTSKYIFIPAAGVLGGGSGGRGDECLIWSSMVSGMVHKSDVFDITPDFASFNSYYRSNGLSIRGVLG